MIHYGMTKTAQIAVARGLAELTAGTGITVNSVLPGPTRSEGVETFVGQAFSAASRSRNSRRNSSREVRPNSLIKRFESVEEIADLVTFVASPLASVTTGAIWRADGGVVKSAF